MSLIESGAMGLWNTFLVSLHFIGESKKTENLFFTLHIV